jgi:restriction system protein
MPDHPYFNPEFVGRNSELEWLDKQIRTRRSRATPIIITGVPGIGKTTLINQFLSSRRSVTSYYDTLWFQLFAEPNSEGNINDLFEQLHQARSSRMRDDLIVVLDAAEQFNDSQLSNTISRVFNYKRVSHLIISSRRKTNIERAEYLDLEGLSPKDIEAMLRRLIPDHDSIDFDDLGSIVNSTHGLPLAISLISSFFKQYGPEGLGRILGGQLYNIYENTTQQQIIQVVKPKIISAQEALIVNLKKRPETIFDITPRNFEEVLAELLEDMGFEVELTKATHDGGKDILAYLNTPIGKQLCLVDAKKYSKTRKVGIDLVRTLYGTLCDYQANSAMLVTTSSFTKDAKTFQKKHHYMLSLKDYSDVVQWLQNYRRGVV